MKKIIICGIIFFNGLIVLGQPAKEKLEQLKAQLKMIQKRADSITNTMKNGTVKQTGTRPQVNTSGTGITAMELPKPDAVKIYALPKKYCLYQNSQPILQTFMSSWVKNYLLQW